MNLKVRSICNADFSVCADILVAAYSGPPWYNTWTNQEAQRRIKATMSGSNARGYVIEQNSKVVAMCLGRIDYYFSNWSQFCIDEFNVVPNLQGQGIGKELINFTSYSLRKDGINRILLITGGEKAAKFYKKNGFVVSDDGIMLESLLHYD